MKRQITERTLVARINRKLASESQKLKKTRHDSHDFANLGNYYIVDQANNTISASHIDDLAAWSHDNGLLAGYEELVI